MIFSVRAVLILLFSAALASACGKKVEPVKDLSPVIEGDRVILAEGEKSSAFLKTDLVREDQGSTLRLPGRLVWNENKTVRVYPQLAGRVLRIHADIGSEVKAGQALASLSSPDFGQVQAELKKAQADAALSKKALQRSLELLQAGVIAQKEAEQVEADFVRNQAEAERAESRLRLLGRSSHSVDQSYTLSSPIAGTVVERNLNVGQEFRFDQINQAPFVVTDPTSLWIQIDVSEANLAAVKEGAEFLLEVNQLPGQTFPGKILHIADFVDPQTRTIKVRAVVPNPERRLKGEMFVTIAIVLPPSGHLIVPSKAVFLVGSERFVFVEEAEGKYIRRKLETGTERNGMIEVRKGLSIGEEVVIEGNLHLLKFFKPASADDKK